MNLRFERNPELAVKIIQKAGAHLARVKGNKLSASWQPQCLTMDYIIKEYKVTPDEFIVIYADEVPIAAAVFQRGDKIKWAPWPTEKEAMYGYHYAGNPDVPMFKTKIIFDAMKKYAAQIGVPVIRIDIGAQEFAKFRMYTSQGFKKVGVVKNPDLTDKYLLLEYDPAESKAS